MSYQDASRAIEDYITALFQANPGEKLPYHNFNHTSKVVDRANEIAAFYNLDDEQLFITRASAWFHDVGYLFTGSAEHEQESVRVMKEFVPDFITVPALI